MPNLLKARGLITYRNEINVAEGAMDVADNIIIDEDDVVEPRRGQGDFGDKLPLDNQRIKQVAEYKNLLLRHYNSTLQFDNGAGTFTDFSGSYQELEDGLRIKYLEANGNFYFTDVTGIKKISARTSSQIGQNSIEDAGVPRAVSLEASLKYNTAGFLPPQSKCAYRVLWGKKDNNNNLLLGYPSERFEISNTSDSTELFEKYEIKVLVSPIQTEYIVIHSTTESYFLWFNRATTEPLDEAPETSVTLGKTPLRVDISDDPSNLDSVASKIANAISAIADFNVSVSSNIVTVTLADSGNVDNAEAYNGEVVQDNKFKIQFLEQGSVTEGTSANVEVSFTVPAGIDNTYFYQIYRTSAVTVPVGLTLDDISSFDEMNLVYEGNPLDSEGNLLTTVTVEDITPEDFRASADFLYTNPISGEGILQANARPPVAKDITLFSGSNFYANTKTSHRFTLNLVSVLNMVSGTSDLIIGNSDVVRRFTAVGTKQQQDITVETGALNEKAFFINSARDEREYFLWYDQDGKGSQPSADAFSNKVPLRVRLNTDLIGLFDETNVLGASNQLSFTSHGLSQGDTIILETVSGSLPTGLSEDTYYTVVGVATNSFALQLDGASVVFSDANPGDSFNVRKVESLSDIATKTAQALGETGDFLINQYYDSSELDSTSDIIDPADQIQLTNHGLEVGDEIILKTKTGSLPTGLEDRKVYTVHSVGGANQFRISDDGGATFVTFSASVGTFIVSLVSTSGSITTAFSLSNTIDITWAKNGKVSSGADDPQDPTYDTEFTFSDYLVAGTGEDFASNSFLLSSIASVAASIDETARSLVRVINADSQSPVNAFYLSGSDDVPGSILLEARDLEDDPFYIATSDSNVQEDFDPSLTLEKEIITTTNNGDGTTTLQVEDLKNIFPSQSIYVYNESGSLPFQQQKYEVVSVNTVEIPEGSGNFEYYLDINVESLVSGNGKLFVATNESDNEESLNRLYFSKAFQPESVPLVNYIDIGPRDSAILRILPLRDNLFALKEDGIYIISGSSAPNFSVRLLDSSVSLVAPDSAVVLNNAIYALADDGVVRISDTGVQVISRNIEDLIKKVVNFRFNYQNLSFGIGYSSDRSYLLWLPTIESDTVATQCYRYNTFTRTWTRFTISATCGLVASRDDKMYLGAGDRNSLTQERKNGDRTDYADKEYNLTIQPNSVNDNVIKVSSVLDLEEGDVIYQEQYITLSILKNLVRKLDLDYKVKSPTETAIIDSTLDVNAATDSITVTSHGITNGSKVKVKLETGSLPGNLSNGETYTAIIVDSDTIKLSADDGATVVDLTDNVGSFLLQILLLDYEDEITLEPGIKVSSTLDAIIDKLIQDGVPVPDITTSDDLETQKNQYNNLMDKLNNSEETSFKNYRQVTEITPYEMIVESINSIDNSVTLYQAVPFLEGQVTVFEGIDAKWQYAPQHFGDASVMKQVRQGTIIFDQNNFYKGVIAYASDLSADFVDIPFSGYGVGDWGTGQWRDKPWGGSGNDIPHRTLVPLEKQRCRYLTVQIRHNIARETIRVNGISLMVRVISNRAYR